MKDLAFHDFLTNYTDSQLNLMFKYYDATTVEELVDVIYDSNLRRGQMTSAEDCEKWRLNKTVDPKTGRKITKNTKTYKQLERDCEHKTIVKRRPKPKQRVSETTLAPTDNLPPTLTNYELYPIALQIEDIKTLINFCKTNQRMKDLVCNNPEFWKEWIKGKTRRVKKYDVSKNNYYDKDLIIKNLFSPFTKFIFDNQYTDYYSKSTTFINCQLGYCNCRSK